MYEYFLLTHEMTDLSYTVTRLLKEFILNTILGRMVLIPASMQGVGASSQKYFIVLVQPVKPYLGPGFSGDAVIHSTTPVVSGCSHKCSPPLEVLSKMTSEALKKAGVFSQAHKGFNEVTFLASCSTSPAETRAGPSF